MKIFNVNRDNRLALTRIWGDWRRTAAHPWRHRTMGVWLNGRIAGRYISIMIPLTPKRFGQWALAD